MTAIVVLCDFVVLCSGSKQLIVDKIQEELYYIPYHLPTHFVTCGYYISIFMRSAEKIPALITSQNLATQNLFWYSILVRLTTFQHYLVYINV